ncbi:unnamed protein product [Gongylonema pulchrum]|uniref:Kunitz/Bovine pancreatic trypsin inhibitor domain protein n=1 Tax=Gongylonema pulchrum TaxID=637853 RepID=A0A183D9Y1_9BILA|nr:unnamed protein product [Gongylonema pulchrum]
MDQGTGVMQQRRYYFNKSTKQCEQFYYRGANGNRNNFGSLQQCQQQCPETPSPCAYGSSFPQTPCHGSNVMNDPCGSSQFCHIGQSPPTTVCCNRSRRGSSCGKIMAFCACSGTIIHCLFTNPIKTIIIAPLTSFLFWEAGHCSCNIRYRRDFLAFGDRCSQALNTGIGNANLQRWYFNVNSEQCEPFIYRGLQGNENNFLNQQDCESACFGLFPLVQ